MRCIGLDVHRDFCEVAIAEGGEVRTAGGSRPTPAALELFAQSLAAEDQVVLEATGPALRDRADPRAARRAGRGRQPAGGAARSATRG